MRVEHNYELSSLAKSLKTQLGLTNFTNSQILEVLAKAANAPSYGHMKAKASRTANQTTERSTLDGHTDLLAHNGSTRLDLEASSLEFPRDEGYVRTSAWSDDRVIEIEFDGRPFLYHEKAKVVFDAVMSQLFHGGRTEETDQIVHSSFSQTEPLSQYLSLIQSSKGRSEPIGFEAEIDAVSALKFLRGYRPLIFMGREMDLADYAMGNLEFKGEILESWSQVFGSADPCFGTGNIEVAREFIDALMAHER